MKSSTSKKKIIIKIFSILFWILLWWLLAAIIDERVFLPSPFETIKGLIKLLPSPDFWRCVLFSSSRVVVSFLISFILAFIFGSLGGSSELFDTLFSPLIKAMRSIPVASIVILVLLWVKSSNLSIVVSLLVVFPILYSSFSTGLRSINPLILEAADSYEIKGWKRIRYIYFPSLFPYIESGIKSSLGLCWKSAVAAEVIGLPSSSIGSKLYEAKIYLDTPSLFSLTIVIVVLAVIFESFMLFLVKMVKGIVER